MPADPSVPVDPIPNPRSGDANMPSPVAQSQPGQKPRIGQAEPRGDRDHLGLNTEAESNADQPIDQSPVDDPENMPRDDDARHGRREM